MIWLKKSGRFKISITRINQLIREERLTPDAEAQTPSGRPLYLWHAGSAPKILKQLKENRAAYEDEFYG